MSSREVIAKLKEHGWELVHIRGGHHQYKHPTKPGRVTVPHPKQDLPRGTLSSIYRQAGWQWKPESRMHFPVVLHKDIDSDYGVTVPDLPGCFSAGATMEEALTNAVEAIELHLEGMLVDGEPLPLPKQIEEHQQHPDYADGVWALVTVDLSRISGKSKRVNITLPERLLAVMDQYAAQHGETRSGLIAQAAMAYIATAQTAEVS